MKFLLLVILTGCAVKCDDGNNYYVIQMPEDPPRATRKPFKVYWNVPSFQCINKKILFENLYEKFGIIQNENDSFRGDKIAILYDPGNFPALLKNETSGKYFFRNGGVPQEGDLEKHLERFRNITEQSIPDPHFGGVGIVDFESWRPVFRQNFGTLVPYKDVSYEVERKKHWLWPNSWIVAEARKRFEESARMFMQKTLAAAKHLRPNAQWGYYGFPYCFNMAPNHMVERCADQVPAENDHINWLWSESTALFPSVYSSRNLSTSQLLQMVRGRVKEAARVGLQGSPILPYFWFRYRDAGFLTEEDLHAVLKTLYKSNATGIVIWGSSRDVDTTDKCIKLLKYTENVMGPAIAKYTKDNRLNNEVLNDNDDFVSDTSNKNNDNNTTTTTTSTVNPIIKEPSEHIKSKPIIDNGTTTTNAPLKNIEPDLADPEFDWVPPENYTQDIVKYVEEEFRKRSNETVIANENRNKSVPINNNDIVLDFIKNMFNIVVNKSNPDIKNTEVKNCSTNNRMTEEVSTSNSDYESIEISERYDVETSNYSGTYVPMRISSKDEKKGPPNSFMNFSTITETFIEIENITSIDTETSTYTTENYNKETTEISEQNIKFYNEDTLFDPEIDNNSVKSGLEPTELTTVTDNEGDITIAGVTTESINLNLANDTVTTTEGERDFRNNKHIETSTYLTEDEYLTTARTESNVNYEEKRQLESTNKSEVKNKVTSNNENISSSSTVDQIAGSAHTTRPRYFFCLFFYFYSVSKCLCEIYGQCT